MKWRARHFWRWLLHTPLTVSSSPRASHVAANNQLLLIVFEFLYHSSRRHPPADINKHKQQNQASSFETRYRHIWRWLPKQPLPFYRCLKQPHLLYGSTSHWLFAKSAATAIVDHLAKLHTAFGMYQIYITQNGHFL